MAGALSELLVSFGIDFDTAPLDIGQKKIDGTLAKLKKFGAALAGAFAVKQVYNFVEGQVAVGAELQHQADLLGLSTKALEQWRYAASFANIGAEELNGMFMRVSRAALMGAEGTGKHAAAMKKLVGEVKPTESVAEVFEQIGLKLASMKDGFEKTALAAKFFGRADGQKVLELFKDGADGIKKFREEFEALGGGMGDFPKKAKEVEASQKRLGFVWDTLKTRIAGVLLPALEWVTIKLVKLGAAFIKITDGTEILGVAIGVLSALATAAAIRIIVAYAPVILPFLLWAAAIAAVILVAEDLFGFFEGRRSLIGRVIDALFGDGSAAKVQQFFQSIKDFAVESFDKLKAIFGDTTLSFREKMDEFLTWVGGEFGVQFTGTFGDIVSGVVAIFKVAFDAISATIESLGKAVHWVSNLLGGDDKPPEYAPDPASHVLPQLTDESIHDAFAPAVPKGKPKGGLGRLTPKGIHDAFVPPGSVPAPRLPSSWDAPAPVAPVVNNSFLVAPGTPQAQQAQIASAAERGTRKGLHAPNRAAAAGLGRTVPR